MNVRAASGAWRPTEAQTAYHLGRFVRLVRSLPTDGVVLRENWLEAYKFLTPPAAARLNEIAREDDPFLIARACRAHAAYPLDHPAVGSSLGSFVDRARNQRHRLAARGKPIAASSPLRRAVRARPTRSPSIRLGLLISDFSWSRVR